MSHVGAAKSNEISFALEGDIGSYLFDEIYFVNIAHISGGKIPQEDMMGLV